MKCPALAMWTNDENDVFLLLFLKSMQSLAFSGVWTPSFFVSVLVGLGHLGDT